MSEPSRSSRLTPFFSSKFLKFCTVGASGVIVNLGVLAILRAFDMRSSFASAWAIEVSILSNFVMNELWTFRDQRDEGTVLARAGRFQLVSLVGAAIQWSVFLIANLGCLWWLSGSEAIESYFAAGDAGFAGSAKRLIMEPPDVGHWIYLSQIVGIGVATVWNYLANFYWTWRTGDTDP